MSFDAQPNNSVETPNEQNNILSDHPELAKYLDALLGKRISTPYIDVSWANSKNHLTYIDISCENLKKSLLPDSNSSELEVDKIPKDLSWKCSISVSNSAIWLITSHEATDTTWEEEFNEMLKSIGIELSFDNYALSPDSQKVLLKATTKILDENSSKTIGNIQLVEEYIIPNFDRAIDFTNFSVKGNSLDNKAIDKLSFKEKKDLSTTTLSYEINTIYSQDILRLTILNADTSCLIKGYSVYINLHTFENKYVKHNNDINIFPKSLWDESLSASPELLSELLSKFGANIMEYYEVKKRELKLREEKLKEEKAKEIEKTLSEFDF